MEGALGSAAPASRRASPRLAAPRRASPRLAAPPRGGAATEEVRGVEAATRERPRVRRL